MTRRACERIPSSLVVKFLHENSICYGIVTNISEKGMCIKSGVCLPCDSHIKLQIPLKDQHLEVSVKVRRVVKDRGFYDTMGVELLKPTRKYLKIVDRIKNTLEFV
jgi:hypothetical protein